MKAVDWGLQGRRLDRDQLAQGWEIVKLMDDQSLTVLSYHLFLHSYDIDHGRVLYAIVKK